MKLIRSLTALMLAAAASLAVPLAGAPAAQADTLICDQYGATTIQGKYRVMNNRWGSSAEQCISVNDNGFRIASQKGSTATNGAPLSYPAIYVGCHYDGCSPGTTLPRQLSRIGAAPSSIEFGYAGGIFDAAYDIWMDPSPKTTGVNQMEIMIWFHRQGGVSPVGSPVGNTTIGGRSWQVWQGNNGGNDVVSYVAPSAIPSWSFDVMDFVRDVDARTRVDSSWYLTSIQAGFEPWQGGEGLSVNRFSADITTGSSGTAGTLRGQGSGRCLDIAEWGTADGTPVQLWDCGTGWNQQWSRSGGRLVNPQSGKCLDVNGGSTANGAPVQLWTCNGTGAQAWQVNANGTVTNPPSGKCLDAAGSGNGTRLRIWDCALAGTNANQTWSAN